MADSTAQREAEQWVIDEALPGLFGQRFRKRQLPLEWGGNFEFDGVSDDGQIVVSISTGAARTISGRTAVGTVHKIRADTLFLQHCAARRRVLVFTERSMLEYFQREQAAGRFPSSVELVHVPLPPELSERVAEARRRASDEVRPRRSDLLP